MGSKSSASVALIFLFNILFFFVVSSCGTCPKNPPNNPRPTPTPTNPRPNPTPNPNNPNPNPNPNPNNPNPNPNPNPNNPNPNNPNPNNPNPNPNNPNPNPNPTPSNGNCPRDALKLGVCANLLGGLVGVVIGTPPVTPCCTLIQGLVDLEAAVCLCTAIRANVLGINLNVPVSLSLILNNCGRRVPRGFQCA